LLLCAALTAFSVTTAKADYVINFSDLTFANTTGTPASQLVTHPGLVGTLTSVTATDIQMSAQTGGVWASDLGIMVSNQTSVNTTANGGAGFFQVGGFNSFGAAKYQAWGAGNSTSLNLPFSATITLGTPITFNGNAGDPNILLGHLWNSNSNATWSGSITLNGVSAIPEPSAFLALAVCGGVGLLRRRRVV